MIVFSHLCMLYDDFACAGVCVWCFVPIRAIHMHYSTGSPSLYVCVLLNVMAVPGLPNRSALRPSGAVPDRVCID